ncbi:MAG: hypothetical protein E7408_02655 [Ruminococcaceae bacterium]|nr:hypothetical protein [Oscillospiraceae bacterium]
MAKKGMKRIDRTHNQPKNAMPPVPEIQSKVKSGEMEANAILAEMPEQKMYHKNPHADNRSPYSAVHTDLARDNLENDLPAADLQDL